MSVANTVEATLRSRYIDGVTEGIRRTQASLQSAMSYMQGMFETFSAAVSGGADTSAAALAGFGRTLLTQSNGTQASFSAMSLAVIGFGLVGVAWFARLVAAAASWVVGVLKASAETLELKLIFEGLAKTAGVDATDALNKLRAATEGLIKDQILLKNANRVLQADIPISIAQYTELVANVYKLAKASGADAVQAQNMLTDAVVKGNARGFQAIGVQLQVKDAINEMAVAQGVATSKMETDSRLRAFYNELIAKTSEAVKRNGTDYFSFADAVELAHNTIERWTNALGEGLGRSKVFSELMSRYASTLLEAAAGQEEVNSLALGFNSAIIIVLKTLDLLLVTAALVAPIFVAIWQAGVAVFNGIRAAIGLALTALITLAAAVVKIADALAQLAGVDWFAPLANQLDNFSRAAGRATIDMAGSAADAVANIFNTSTSQQLGAYSTKIYELIRGLESFRGQTVAGEAGVRGMANATDGAARDAKKYAEQLKALRDIMRELGNTLSDPSQQNLNGLMENYRKIDQLRMLSDEQREAARLRALEVYRQAEVKLAKDRDKAGQDQRERALQMISDAEQLQAESDKRTAETATQHATEYTQHLKVLSGEVAREQQALFDAVIAAARKKREEEQERAVNDAVSTANAITKAIELSRAGKLSRQTGEFAQARAAATLAELQAQLAKIQAQDVITPEQIDQVLKLKAAIEALNTVNLTPFQASIKQVKDLLKSMVTSVTESFANLMADLVTGQESAGKKFVAALIGMVADALIYFAKLAAGYAVVKAIAGDWGGAAIAAAAAASLAAGAGILKGIAANMAQTSQAAGSSGSFQTTTPRPIGGTTQQIINVGAPGRAQDPGAAQATAHETVVRIEVPQGFVAREVERNLKGNGKLRTVIANYGTA